MENNNEQKGNEGAEKTEVNTSNGLSVIEEAKKYAEENRKLLEQLKAENDRYEKLKAQDLLSGNTTVETQAQPKELSPMDYAKKVMSNSA